MRNENDIVTRAIRAWARRCRHEGLREDQGSSDLSEMREVHGRTEVVVKNTRGTLATYLLDARGRLSFVGQGDVARATI